MTRSTLNAPRRLATPMTLELGLATTKEGSALTNKLSVLVFDEAKLGAGSRYDHEAQGNIFNLSPSKLSVPAPLHRQTS
jgi:hypothetical protein